MPSFLAYVVVGGAAALVTFVCVPIMIRLAPRLGTMVLPSERHVHASPTPTAGGAAMILGVIVAVAVAAVHPEFSEVMEARTEMVGVVVAACAVVVACGDAAALVRQMQFSISLHSTVLLSNGLNWKMAIVEAAQPPGCHCVVSPDSSSD